MPLTSIPHQVALNLSSMQTVHLELDNRHSLIHSVVGV